MLAAAGGTTMWYLTRGSGVVALLTLTASVVLGLLSSGRWESRRWPRFVVQGLHRNVSLVVLIFLALHVATTVVDGFVPIGWKESVIPFFSAYRPVWIGLGALAVDCLIAIVVTSLIRLSISAEVWRSVHMLAYACWPIALVHGLGAGTDTRQRWMLGVDAVCTLAVAAALWWRLLARRPARRQTTSIALAASIIVPLLVGAFAWIGPMQPGWSSHGGRLGAAATTVAASGFGASAPVVSAPVGATSAPRSLPSRAEISGTRSVADADGTRTVTLATTSAEGSPSVNIELLGTPDPSGGVVLRGGTVTVRAGDPAATWSGAVISLHADTLRATLTGPTGRSVSFVAQLSVDRSTGTFAGSVELGSSSGGSDGNGERGQ